MSEADALQLITQAFSENERLVAGPVHLVLSPESWEQLNPKAAADLP